MPRTGKQVIAFFFPWRPLSGVAVFSRLAMRLAERGIRVQVYFNSRCGRITVGANTLFGEGVIVLTGKHMNIEGAMTENVSRHYVLLSGRRINSNESRCCILL